MEMPLGMPLVQTDPRDGTAASVSREDPDYSPQIVAGAGTDALMATKQSQIIQDKNLRLQVVEESRIT
ncbi:hypothetical protein A2U01_0099853 [Trifolium medium]|uniref:Uncharacterized protein n=1 Tax=Trifolium medium TaxID=97028 RepID=A0A392UTM9_9FABA|nr:hypothetical protein [Trifolium medium]